MRVLQTITDTDRRGAQVFAVDLHHALSRRGHTVATVALAPGAIGGLAVEALGPHRRGARALRALRSLAGGHDVLVGHGSATLAAGLAVAGTGTPFVYRQISDSEFWARSVARRLRVRAYYRHPRQVVALSARAASVLATRFGVDRARITVVPNGVPTAAFEPPTAPERSSARDTLGIGCEPTVAYVGALVAEKGLDVLLDAVAAQPQLRLVVAGDGPERGRLERRAQALAGHVTFLGAVPTARDVLAAADVVVLPSLGGDSMPAVLIEAGLMGLPTVATSVGEIGEVVIDGTTGLLVTPGDASALGAAIGRVLQPGERQRLGDEARRRCLERFDIDVVAARWDAVLHEVVAST